MSTKVVVSPNIKKESVRIDTSGNIINPNTKEILKKNDDEETPQIPQTPPQCPPEASGGSTTNDLSKRINSMVEAKIQQKIDEIVAKKVEEAFKNL